MAETIEDLLVAAMLKVLGETFECVEFWNLLRQEICLCRSAAPVKAPVHALQPEEGVPEGEKEEQIELLCLGDHGRELWCEVVEQGHIRYRSRI